MACRLAETGEASVLLLEAGGTDDLPSVSDPGQWHANLKTDRDWGFEAVLNPRLNGRRLPLSMGRVLGGGSSINVMGWARGHKNDRDYFAEEAGDTGALVTRVVLEGKRAVGVEFPPRGRNPSYQGAPPDRAFAWRHQHAQGADAIGHRR